MSNSVAPLQIPTACPQCKIPLLAPAWSECVNGHKAVHIWHCPMCANEFETVDDNVGKTLSHDELVDKFFPSLLVA